MEEEDGRKEAGGGEDGRLREDGGKGGGWRMM